MQDNTGKTPPLIYNELVNKCTKFANLIFKIRNRCYVYSTCTWRFQADDVEQLELETETIFFEKKKGKQIDRTIYVSYLIFLLTVHFVELKEKNIAASLAMVS